jgi:hypothetical protein
MNLIFKTLGIGVVQLSVMLTNTFERVTLIFFHFFRN